MYDQRILNVGRMANRHGFTTLKPASNTIIIKEAANDADFAEYLESVVNGLEGAKITWTENTAEITVNKR